MKIHSRYIVIFSIAFLFAEWTFNFAEANAIVDENPLRSIVMIKRDKLAHFADTIKTTADAIKQHVPLWIKNETLKRRLIRHNEFLENTYNHVAHFYQLYDAIQKDIERPGNGKYKVLSSHTLEQSARIGLDVLPDIIDQLHKLKVIKKPFPVSTFGVDDILTAAARQIGSGKVDIDTITLYLDGVNKAAWGILGLVLSKGNLKVASDFQSIGSTAASLGRLMTASAFKTAYNKVMGVDKAIIQKWRDSQQMQIKHLGKNAKLQSIEEYYGYDKQVLSILSRSQRHQANREFGLASPNNYFRKTPQTKTTRISYSYREICQSGYCTRTFKTPSQPKGISMRMKVDNTSFKPDTEGHLNNVRDQILKSRPSSESLSWPQ